MKKKMKKINWQKYIAIILAAMMILGSIAALQSAVNAEDAVEVLTQAKAVELALANNLELKIAEQEQKETNITRSQQNKIAKEDDPTGSYDLDLLVEVAKVNKENLTKLAQATYNSSKLETELAAKNAYAQLVNAKEAYTLAEKNKAQAEEALRFAKKKQELGQASNVQVLSAEAELSSKQAALSSAEITYKQKLMDINVIMNQELNKQWTIDANVELKTVELKPLEELKQAMLTTHPAALGADLSYKIAEAKYLTAKGFYPENVWTYQLAQVDYEQAKYQYELTKRSQEKALNQAYIGVEGSINTVNALKKSVEATAEAYRIAKLRYDLGLVTAYDVNEAALQLNNMENNLLSAKLGYMLAVSQLEYISGVKQ